MNHHRLSIHFESFVVIIPVSLSSFVTSKPHGKFVYASIIDWIFIWFKWKYIFLIFEKKNEFNKVLSYQWSANNIISMHLQLINGILTANSNSIHIFRTILYCLVWSQIKLKFCLWVTLICGVSCIHFQFIRFVCVFLNVDLEKNFIEFNFLFSRIDFSTPNVCVISTLKTKFTYFLQAFIQSIDHLFGLTQQRTER